jgi:hypothetical protein
MATPVPDSFRKIPLEDNIGFSTYIQSKKDTEAGDEFQEFASATSLTGPRYPCGAYAKSSPNYDIEDATKQYTNFNIIEYLKCYRWSAWFLGMARPVSEAMTFSVFGFAQTGKLLEKLNHRMIVLENDNALLHDRITALEKRNNQLETELNLQTIVNDTTIASDPIESVNDDMSDSNSDSSSGSESDSDDDVRETEQQLQPNKCKME